MTFGTGLRPEGPSAAIKPVVIQDKVWMGFGASTLKGVTIGEGAVIGAQGVVTRDLEPYAVIAGNPARVIRRITPEAVLTQDR
nr:hypothetical protein [Rhizobium mesosinicum]